MNKQISSNQAQGGMVLIEALIAMLVLALGIFGLMGVQTRTIVETRITNNRALAIRQINDLNERIWLNREKALNGDYNVDAFADPPTDAPAGCSAGVDADRQANAGGANTDDVARCDIWRWRRALAANITGAQAQVQRVPGTNQIRIQVAWPLNEKVNADGSNPGLHASLQTTAAGGGGGVICPQNFICHLQFLEL